MVHYPPYPNPPNQSEKKALDQKIYHNPDVLDAAKNLLGLSLFTTFDGHLTGGIITETEGYAGVQDKASHAYGGRLTKRTEVMYRPGGVAYIYLCYGIHALLNVVTGPAGTPHAVLIRAIQPTHGLDIMLKRRKKEPLTDGPGTLTAALGITASYTGSPLDSPPIFITDLGFQVQSVTSAPRIGIDYAEEWKDLPYRFIANL